MCLPREQPESNAYGDETNRASKANRDVDKEVGGGNAAAATACKRFWRRRRLLLTMACRTARVICVLPKVSLIHLCLLIERG